METQQAPDFVARGLLDEMARVTCVSRAGLLYDPGHRREMLRNGWKDVGRIFVLAIVMDVAYQLLVIGSVYPLETLIVATVLASIPYLLIRGPVTRIARLARRQPPQPRRRQRTGTPP